MTNFCWQNREWYHSSQQIVYYDDAEYDSVDIPRNDGNVIYEDATEEDDGSSPPTPETSEHKQKSRKADERPSKSLDASTVANLAARKQAQSELKTHEITALLCCLAFPALGALLLHGIRNQLSRPSEGLVSNFNLSVFILASEVRPLAHMIRLVRKRTLYLQRVVATHPLPTREESSEDGPLKTAIPEDILERLRAVEMASHSRTNGGDSNAQLQGKITTDVRLSVQPSLDALNRAVRRYEKRATLQSMQTEGRLQELEARLQDALVLAAAAAKGTGIGSEKARNTPVTVLWNILTGPFRALSWVFSFPLSIASNITRSLESLPFIRKATLRRRTTLPPPPSARHNGTGSTGKRRYNMAPSHTAGSDAWERKWENVTATSSVPSLGGAPTAAATTIGSGSGNDASASKRRPISIPPSSLLSPNSGSTSSPGSSGVTAATTSANRRATRTMLGS
jgi:hypothetical protein